MERPREACGMEEVGESGVGEGGGVDGEATIDECRGVGEGCAEAEECPTKAMACVSFRAGTFTLANGFGADAKAMVRWSLPSLSAKKRAPVKTPQPGKQKQPILLLG